MGLLRKTGAKLRAFLHDVGRSCYDMEYYRGVRTSPWTDALRYFAAMLAFFVVFGVAVFAPFAVGARTRLVAHLRERIPDGVTFRFEKGRFSTTLPTHMDLGAQGFPVIVDTTVEGLTALDQAPQDGLLVGRDAVFMSNGQDRRAYPLSDVPDSTFTKVDVLAWLDRWSGPFLAGGIVLLALLWYGASFIGIAAYVLIGAIAAMLAGRLFGANLDYRRWVATGFHAVTLPIIVDFSLGTSGMRIPYAYSFIFFMFVAAVIADERSQPTGGAPLPRRKPRGRRRARGRSAPAGPPEPPKTGE